VPANSFSFVAILHLSRHNNWLFALKKAVVINQYAALVMPAPRAFVFVRVQLVEES
jgi:hypothetical protein